MRTYCAQLVNLALPRAYPEPVPRQFAAVLGCAVLTGWGAIKDPVVVEAAGKIRALETAVELTAPGG